MINMHFEHQILNHQLSIIEVTTKIKDYFYNDVEFINKIIDTNLFLLVEILQTTPKLETIMVAINMLKDMITLINKKIKQFLRSTQTTRPKNIYLNQVHNIYALFIIEFNKLIEDTEIKLKTIKISQSGLDKIIYADSSSPNSSFKKVIPLKPTQTPRTPSVPIVKPIKKSNSYCFIC